MTLTTYVKIIQIGGGSPILHNYPKSFQNTIMKFIFIKYFPSYETQNLQSSVLALEP